MAWPPVRDRVMSLLRSRNVQAADADDIVQEVAIRAMGRDFDTSEHMVRWCCRVAINLHIDSTRRVRRISREPLAERAAPHNVSETVEGRLDLDAVLAKMAGLSEEDQALLFQLPPTDSRKEQVRLAVRRHRLRARLAAMVEGVLAGVPGLRRLLHSESLVARAAVVAVPVIAMLTALPFVAGIGPGRAGPGDRGIERSSVETAPAASAASRSARSTTTIPRLEREGGAAPTPVSGSRPLVELHPAGNTIGVREDPQPEHAKTLCLAGYVNLCVDRPRPTVSIPPLPLPAVPDHAS